MTIQSQGELPPLPEYPAIFDPGRFGVAYSAEQMRAYARQSIAAAAVGGGAPLDIEAMLRECVPGGSICDPQQVADSIRAWFAALNPDS